MNAYLLINAVVQQTMVFIAQLATSGGVRAPLAHVAEQVFLDLTNELSNRGVKKKVIADMCRLQSVEAPRCWSGAHGVRSAGAPRLPVTLGTILGVGKDVAGTIYLADETVSTTLGTVDRVFVSSGSYALPEAGHGLRFEAVPPGA